MRVETLMNYRAGRAVSQLAIRSALRQQAGSVWPCGPLLSIPQPAALWAFAAASPPAIRKFGPKNVVGKIRLP